MEFYDYGDVKTCVFAAGGSAIALEYVGGNINDSLQLLCDNKDLPDPTPVSVDVDLDELLDALEKIAGAMGLAHTATALDDAQRAYRMERP